MNDADLDIIIEITNGRLTGQAKQDALDFIAADPELSEELAIQVSAMDGLAALKTHLCDLFVLNIADANKHPRVMAPASQDPDPREQEVWCLRRGSLCPSGVSGIGGVAASEFLLRFA